MSVLWQDILYGVRMLAKRPVITLIAAFSLALGIGLNTAIFTLMNTILLGSLPYPNADRLVGIFSVSPEHLDQLQGVSIPDLFSWKEMVHSFEAIGAANVNAYDFGAEENGQPAERIVGEVCTPGLLQALGVQPYMGRNFNEADDEVDHPAPVIMITHRLWIRRFGGVPDILNRKVLVNGVNTSIVGVLPADFRFQEERADFLAPIPLNHFQLQGSARFLTVAAKLKPGVTLKQAQSELEGISVELARRFPKRDTDHGKPWTVRLQPVREMLYGFIDRPLLLLQGAVGFVLLIACANVAALLLARASSRRSEVSIRAALGAGRVRIFRQFLTESLLLSLFSGALGIGLAWWGVHVLVSMAPPWLPRLHAIALNTRVLLFSIAVSILTGLIFGVVPAAQGSKLTFAESLKDATRGGTSGGARSRLRSSLVAAQLALALILLIGSGLLIRSFLQLQNADLGCDPAGLLTFRLRSLGTQYSKPVSTYKGFPLWETSPVPAQQFRQILDRMKTLPGVRNAAASAFPPLVGNNPINFEIQGRNVANPDDFNADFFLVSENFFNTMKISMLRGRDFTARDNTTAPWVAIVNETMAKRYFPNEDPVGKRIRFDLSQEDQFREIIAVVHDIPASHPQTRQEPAIFVPFEQLASHILGPYSGIQLQLTYLLRTAGEPMSMLPAVRSAVAEIDRNRPVIDPRTEESYLALQAQYPKYYSMLLGLFASVALLLAAVGIYGVMAYVVEQRTREIGIRIALGAAGWDVLKLIVSQAALIIAIGVGIGLAGAATLTRFISSSLWEVKALDATTFAGVSLLLIAVAIVACLVPTRRAVQVDPTTALRYE